MRSRHFSCDSTLGSVRLRAGLARTVRVYRGRTPRRDVDRWSTTTLSNIGQSPEGRGAMIDGKNGQSDPMPAAQSSSRKPKSRSAKSRTRRGFNAEAYLETTGPARKIVRYREGDVVFAQGDTCSDV